MCKDMPNESSVYAREGSAAHAVGERALREGKDALHYLGIRLEDYPEIEVDEVMCALVQEYLDAVRWEIEKYEIAGYDDAELGVEVRFDLTHIYPEMFGTCDAVVYLPSWARLVVFDYKHGWTSVPVERNKQTMYYALGAIHVKHNRAITQVELVIVQPRSGHRTTIKRWACSEEELLDYRSVLVDGARRTAHPEAALVPGEWCKFCPAAPVCPALSNKVMEICMAKNDPIDGITLPAADKIPFHELRNVWDNAALVETWIKSVKSYAHAQALAGNKLPGTKLVEGRSIRKWSDEEEAKSELVKMQRKGLFPNNAEFCAVKLKSPSQVEAMLPKAERKIIEGLWTKGQGALVLVPESDERPEARPNIEEEFS